MLKFPVQGGDGEFFVPRGVLPGGEGCDPAVELPPPDPVPEGGERADHGLAGKGLRRPHAVDVCFEPREDLVLPGRGPETAFGENHPVFTPFKIERKTPPFEISMTDL